jgi:NifU-like protein involved in Fe-S cluster formation
MSAALYTPEILRLAASLARWPALGDGAARVERRSPTCGSRMIVDLDMGADGRVAAIGLTAHACALGQAAAALLATHAVGRTADELAAAARCWTDYLSGASDALDFWPGMTVLASARAYPARHPSLRLAFEAAARAARPIDKDRRAHG